MTKPEMTNVLVEIEKLLSKLSYGYISIIVQDKKVVQIDVTEKNRLV